MPSLKYLLPALAVAGRVLAQADCNASTITIQNQGDAKALENCQTITGDIVIAGQTSGTIILDGIGRIEGSLICRDAVGLTGIRSRTLNSIDGQFQLYGLTILSELEMTVLSSVGAINWTALPALQNLSFKSQVKQANDVYISNTQLRSLDGINLETVNRFDINNNLYLTKIESRLRNVAEALNIQANGQQKNLVVSFPNMEWAFNMTFWNCSSVNLPSLSSVNQSLGFRGNFFESCSAPNLTQTGIGGSLVVVGNDELTNISFPALNQIGGTFQIADNDELENIDGFRNLSVVIGAVDVSGNFGNFSLPALEDVRGAFNLRTSATFDCSFFDTAKRDGRIKGSKTCEGGPGSSTSSSNPSSTSGGSGASGTRNPNAAGQLQVKTASVLGSIALAAGLLHIAL